MSGSFIIIKISGYHEIPLSHLERIKVRVIYKEFCNGPVVG
jgi:hypothetical protein